jgi:hypothetical protein
MYLEFLLWLMTTAIIVYIEESLFSFSSLINLTIAAPIAAIIMTGILILRNRSFRQHAKKVQAKVESLMPGLFPDAPYSVKVSYTDPNSLKPYQRTLTIDVQTSRELKPGSIMDVWAYRKRCALEPLPGKADFRVLWICLVVMALGALGYVCTLLMSSPAKQ